VLKDIEREWIAREEEPGCSWLWILVALALLLELSC